jgi:uncharacterized protein DUF6636
MRLASALAAMTLAVLVACGSGGSKSSGSTTTAAVATTQSTAPLTLTSFKTPSGNIGCTVDVAYARCDIKDHAWTAPPKPPDCDLDWGDSLQISDKAPPGLVCHGDTVLDPTAPVLAYGQRTRPGTILCESAEAGVTCTSQSDGHGFFLSREAYRLL